VPLLALAERVVQDRVCITQLLAMLCCHAHDGRYSFGHLAGEDIGWS